MKNLVFILLLVTTTLAYSQTEMPKDSLPSLEKKPLQFNENRDQSMDFSIANKANALESTNPDIQPLKKEEVGPEMNLKLPPLDVYLGPPVESNTFTKYPFANDYAFYSGLGINDNTWISSSSIQDTYPTLGAVRTMRMNLNYQPTDWLVVSAGPYGSKYNLGGRALNDVGATGAVKFILHDRIRLNGYGQYSVNRKENGVQGPMMGMYPQTFYGGTIEVKISSKFGIEGGVIRELNPFNGKWVNRPYFAPVFYTK